MTETIDIDQHYTSDKYVWSLEEKVFILFVQASRVFNKYYNAYLNRKLGLSVSKVAALTVLDMNGGVMNPSDIASSSLTERNNITTLIARMSKEGLVRTERDQQNKRLVNVIITDKGKQTLDEAAPVIHEVIRRMLFAMSEDNLYLLERPLRIIRQNAQDGLNGLLES